MLFSVVWSIEELGALEEFDATVAGHFANLFSELVELLVFERLEVPPGVECLFEVTSDSDAEDLGGDGLRERVVDALGCGRKSGGGDGSVLTIGASGESLHTDDSDPVFQADRDDVVLEAAEEVVTDIDRHLCGVPVVRPGDHIEMNARVLVSGEADEANLAGLLGFESGAETSLFEDPFGVIVVVEFVELPEVDVVGVESFEAVVEVVE